MFPFRALRLSLLPILALGVTTVAHGQIPGEPEASSRAPMLHLSASSTIDLAPDELHVAMSAVAIAANPAAAQRQVNALVHDATAELTGQADTKFAVRDYNVFVTSEKPPRWTAQQFLELHGASGDRVLELVGRLQSKGLAIDQLTWRASPERTQRAHDDASTQALHQLQARAAEAAKALGMTVDRFQDVRLDDDQIVHPMVRLATPAMSSMAASQATPEPQQVTARVSADVVLKAGS